MRFDPLTGAEEEMFVREMLVHFGYADSVDHHIPMADGSTEVHVTWKPKKHKDRELIKALGVARTFNAIINNEDEQPATLNDMVDEIRYRMGYGWLAWFLFKNFAIPIIKWLWQRYHTSIPETIGQKV